MPNQAPERADPASVWDATTAADLATRGFALVRAAALAPRLRLAGLDDWAGFARSWDDLGLDRYMADGGRYRQRRFTAFSVSDETIRLKPAQPHYQSRDYNALNGGIARWFEPVTEAVAQHPATRTLLASCHKLFHGLTAAALRPDTWHVEMHQFRIEAKPDAAGLPTPEGLHRDGVDWVLVLLVRRENVARGETTITDLHQVPIGSFTLTDPMDATVVDDSRVYHGVTAIAPLDPARAAFRDVLVLTFRRE